jgi:hypothetical protein
VNIDKIFNLMNRRTFKKPLKQSGEISLSIWRSPICEHPFWKRHMLCLVLHRDYIIPKKLCPSIRIMLEK